MQPPADGAAPGLDAKLQALGALFELAASSTHLDQPLCLDCAAQLKDEVEAQIKEAEQEISPGQQGQGLEAPSPGLEWGALPAAEFEAQLQALRAASEAER
ncbi:uncharacterized protein HaLaN_16235 [Haematococcus lacustris]|uniref:Uncharacterized protein n=1 Tax=Haematococcus lacustris TaxID=44745 RepID=A0A699Z9H6_HAELA|nr:uncharacterized protein HaLaN_16235 [Haematococcus lacustris]